MANLMNTYFKLQFECEEQSYIWHKLDEDDLEDHWRDCEARLKKVQYIKAWLVTDDNDVNIYVLVYLILLADELDLSSTWDIECVQNQNIS
jgi:hypothetical protein